MPEARARHLLLSGQVQGVGFRPFVFRLARELGIRGWVKNVTGRVEIHAEGSAEALETFTRGLTAKAPALARPQLVGDEPAELTGADDFRILDSAASAEADIHLPPDNFVCPDCLAEMQNPRDRRHRYPFINCTQCGPRYTIITALPYDRANTSMQAFPLCADCRAEYEDPADRRFHAEPVACPACGPHLEFVQTRRSGAPDRANPESSGGHEPAELQLDSGTAGTPSPAFIPAKRGLPRPGGGRGPSGDGAALAAAVAALRAGKIVAVKGIGGYHLMCDAANGEAVERLRDRKPRPAKPLAVMFPDLDGLRGAAEVTPEAERLLVSPARPIVLLAKRGDSLPLTPTLSPEGRGSNWLAYDAISDQAQPPSFSPEGRGGMCVQAATLTMASGAPSPGGRGGLCAEIAPGLAEIGCFLPYSPLHHLLLAEFGGPLVATSGNLGGEPVLTDNSEAQARLARIADAFLHHDRPIVRPADDPVFRPIAGRLRPLRLGRGVAPVELALPRALPHPVLALGGHTKNCIALAWGERAVVSPHIGDLDSAKSLDTLARVAADLQALYRVRAEAVLVDRHPGYGYRAWARGLDLPIHEVWHHRAHASALAWESPEVERWIVFAWDGVGLGEDGTLWGGEAFVGGPGAWRRAASFRPFRLPGGDKAGREPWRAAAALLWESGQPAPFAPEMLKAAWDRGLNSPASSAVGRLFDAAASLAGICSQASFEGEGPMRLEAAAWQSSVGAASAANRAMEFAAKAAPTNGVALPLERDDAGLWRSDWAPLLAPLMDTGLTVAGRAALFHASLARALVDQAARLRDESGIMDVGLTGGVFQNRLLTELALAGLEAAGFRVHLAERLPVNDAGIAFGQVAEWLHG